jgi:hypothetical protein
MRRAGTPRRRGCARTTRCRGCVAIALDARPLSDCAAADRDGDGAVRIDELIAALNAALDGP